MRGHTHLDENHKKNQQTAGKYTPKNPDTSRIE